MAADPRTTGGMDLYNLAAGPIILVNPMQYATVFNSTGYFTTEDGERHPIYGTQWDCLAQVQQLTVRDLMQLEQMNLQGSDIKIYLYPSIPMVMPVGVVSRADQTGGDIVHLADGTDWLVTSVLEQWTHTTNSQPNWICVSATRQLTGVPQEQVPPPPPEPPKPPKPPDEDLWRILKWLVKDNLRTHHQLKHIEHGDLEPGPPHHGKQHKTEG